jgi:hypothetical protein
VRAKPRISKADDGWQVELPAFGFHAPVVKDGFPSREDAGRWLATSQNIGTGSQVVERASRPASPHADMNVPKVYR